MWQLTSILTIVTLLAAHSSTVATSGDDFFPIMPWNKLHGPNVGVKGFTDPLESVAECNFTVAGFVQPEQMPGVLLRLDAC